MGPRGIEFANGEGGVRFEGARTPPARTYIHINAVQEWVYTMYKLCTIYNIIYTNENSVEEFE